MVDGVWDGVERWRDGGGGGKERQKLPATWRITNGDHGCADWPAGGSPAPGRAGLPGLPRRVGQTQAAVVSRRPPRLCFTCWREKAAICTQLYTSCESCAAADKAGHLAALRSSGALFVAMASRGRMGNPANAALFYFFARAPTGLIGSR